MKVKKKPEWTSSVTSAVLYSAAASAAVTTAGANHYVLRYFFKVMFFRLELAPFTESLTKTRL